jgi:hypothetical protein
MAPTKPIDMTNVPQIPRYWLEEKENIDFKIFIVIYKI